MKGTTIPHVILLWWLILDVGREEIVQYVITVMHFSCFHYTQRYAGQVSILIILVPCYVYPDTVNIDLVTTCFKHLFH